MMICNAFSLSMLPEWAAAGSINFQKISSAAAAQLLRECQELVESAVGHADVARLFSAQLNVTIPVNRQKAMFLPGEVETILVGQYVGPRLPEGATMLPEGAKIQWFLLRFSEEDITKFEEE